MNPLHQGERVLVVSPHADDAELGCGGVLARVIEGGAEALVVVMVTKGERQSHAPDGYVHGSTRTQEFHAAMQVLGAEHRVLHANERSDFDLCALPKSEVVADLDSVIEQWQPTSVLLPLPSFHQEHQFVFECGVAAARPTRYPSPIRSVLAYEYPAAVWGPSGAWPQNLGACYVGLEERHVQKKLAALACHASQMYRGANALISLEAVQAQLRIRGIEAGVAAAEKLALLRGVW